jgi:hypothetical protein
MPFMWWWSTCLLRCLLAVVLICGAPVPVHTTSTQLSSWTTANLTEARQDLSATSVGDIALSAGGAAEFFHYKYDGGHVQRD